PPLPSGQTYWYQPSWTDGGNVTRWASASPWRLKAPPLERKPAVIRYHSPAANTTRPANLTTTSTFKIRDEDGDVIDHAIKMDALLNEAVLDAGEGGYRVTVQFRGFKFSERR